MAADMTELIDDPIVAEETLPPTPMPLALPKRPLLDRFKASDARIIGVGMTDVNGYLPTHLTERSHKPGPDPVWNDAHCRNKRIFMDDSTRNAVLSERPATLGTYRMELGEESIPVKNIFVPLYFGGRRWGNFELAYVDKAAR